MKLKMESSEQEFKDLIEKRKQEILTAREKLMLETMIKVKRLQLIYVLAELVLTVSGYLIIGFMVSWWLVVGIILISFGDRLQTVRTLYQRKKNIWSEIWKY